MTVEVKDLREIVKFNDQEATVQEMFKTLNLEAEVLCVGAGQFMTPQSEALSDMMFWIQEGEAVFEAGDEVLVLTENTSLLVPAGESVGIINEGNNPLTVLRIKGPAGF